MDRFQYELLLNVKDKYEAAGGHVDYECTVSGPNGSSRQFYVRDLKDNLVRSMDPCHIDQFKQGSGRELNDKMRALRSSSVMTFNLIGNRSCEIVENNLGLLSGKYSVEYEHQASTIKVKGGIPANIDAWLELDQEGGAVIACEMKMMEWLTSKPSSLKDKYFDSEYYRNEIATSFVELAEKLKAAGFSRYDWAQMFKHTVALMNEMLSSRYLGKIHSLDLLNVVWEPVDPVSHLLTRERYYEAQFQEHEEFLQFKKIMKPAEELFSDLCNIEFRIEYLSALDFARIIRRDEFEWAKLGRYF